MTIVAEQFTHVIGVDTHAATHAYAIIDARTGGLIAQRSFPVTGPGIARAVTWVGKHAGERLAFAIEGTGSYGATLTRALQTDGLDVFEVRPPAKGSRARDGKSDQLDALAAARSILHAETTLLATPRAAGHRGALHILSTARRSLRKDKNRARQQLISLLRTHPLEVDARHKVPMKTVKLIASWRTRPTDPVQTATARAEARRLARTIVRTQEDLDDNEKQLRALVTEWAPELLTLTGVGPVSAAVILDAYSHHGRIHSADAFVRMAGISPLPVQSGKTSHHRLNRGQNRALNEAFHTIVNHRLAHDPATIAYAARRKAEGMGTKAIKRVLKRYIARNIFRQLQALTA